MKQDTQLSQRQNEILTFIKKYIVKHGLSPSIRDIAAGVHLNSPATVHTHLKNLITLGYIKRDNNQAIELLVPNEFDLHEKDAISVPFLDQAFPDNYIQLLNEPDDYFYLSAQMIPKGCEVFVLKLAKNIPCFQLLENDYIIIEKTIDTSNNDISIAVTDDTIFLYSNACNSLNLTNEEVKKATTLGRMVGLYREY